MKQLDLLDRVKEAGQDFEWYPTTNAMLEVVSRDISAQRHYRRGSTLLDIGAGNGKALKALTEHFSEFYAIEKSQPLLESLPDHVVILGTEFWEQNLIDKDADVTFCNPPYSEFEAWMCKIIRETNSSLIYFVVPTRWKNHADIKGMLERRKAETEVLRTMDFRSSEDRAARATVDILRVKLHRHSNSAFDVFFDTHFGAAPETAKTAKEEKEKLKQQVVHSDNLIQSLVILYREEMSNIEKSFFAVSDLDPVVLEAINIDTAAVKKALASKLKGTKNRYWELLFENLESLNKRLTESSRRSMQSKILSHRGVDFTHSNIYAIVLWAVKNANKYYDDQLLDCYDLMVSAENVKLYKSNQRVFNDNDWRYTHKNERSVRDFALDYRIVCHSWGGLHTGMWAVDRYHGLAERSYNYLMDLLCVLNNLGYTSVESPKDFEWKSGKKCLFTQADGKPLVEVKAFKNGNIHLKFAQDVMHRLNIEHGRLRGWIHSPAQAAAEMDIKTEVAQEHWDKSFRIAPSALALGMEGGSNE